MATRLKLYTHIRIATYYINSIKSMSVTAHGSEVIGTQIERCSLLFTQNKGARNKTGNSRLGSTFYVLKITNHVRLTTIT